MRRTQLYLDDDLWEELHAKARLAGETVSELVRVAIRERYMGNLEDRRTAMLGIVGLWKDRSDFDNAESAKSLIRTLRDDDRLKRLKLERPEAE